MQMIARMQNGVTLTMGPFEQLNFEALEAVREIFLSRKTLF